MGFFKQLLADAQPKADTLKRLTINLTNQALDSRAAIVAKAIGYQGLVIATIPVALAVPTAAKAWAAIEKAAAVPEAVVVKK